MKKEKKFTDESLVFLLKWNDQYTIRFFTVYQEGRTVKTKTAHLSRHHLKEWELGEEGAVKMVIDDQNTQKKVLVQYSLPDRYINLIALSSFDFTDDLLAAIAEQFYIKKGMIQQFMMVPAGAYTKNQRVITIEIPDFHIHK